MDKILILSCMFNLHSIDRNHTKSCHNVFSITRYNIDDTSLDKLGSVTCCHLAEVTAIFLVATSSLATFLNGESQTHAKDSTGGILSHINQTRIAALMRE